MKTLLVLSITALIFGACFASRPQQQWGPPEQQWGSPEQDQWGGPSQSEWGPPQSQPSPEWYPRPENQCKCIPKSAKTIEITPIVEIDVTHDAVYPCDSTSRVKEILYQKTITAEKITCNGITVYNGDESYDLVYAEPSYAGKQKESVTITNYTLINTNNNGNLNSIECGTIASGRCAGDNFWAVGIFQAEDQTGCCKGGNTGVVSIYRILEIKGKCESRCSLGRSTYAFAEPVSNRGLAVRSLPNEETTAKSD